MKLNSSVNLLAAAVLMTLAGTASANPITITPIGVTGFSSAVIIGPGPGDNFTNDTFGGFQFFTTGTGEQGPTDGLPDNGTILSPNAPSEFQLQPYNQNNVVKSNGTLTLITPAKYTDVSFLVDSQGTNAITFTLNFSTGPSQVVSAVVPNWIGGDPVPFGGTIALKNNNISGIFGQPSQFDEYDFATSSRILDSITISTTGGVEGIYAISGTLDVPEPSTWALMFAGVGALFFVGRMRRKQSV
jgi:hypothetical protein